MGARFQILGELRVLLGDRPWQPRGGRQERLLAALLLDARGGVRISRLIEVIWDGPPPATARRQVQDLVSQLRRELDVRTVGGGYQLVIEPGHLDLWRFESLAAEARQIEDTDSARAADRWREALALWRGPALEGLSCPALAGETARLDEQRLAGWERRLGLDLDLGRGPEVIAELCALVEQFPFRENLIGLLMVAYDQTGRRADALAVFQRARQRLADELGVDVGDALQKVHLSVLRGVPSRPDPAVPRPVPAQLPLDVSAFTGRRTELAWLDGCLTGVCALSGTAGVGKTALAIHWAHRVREKFPDGQLYVNLRGYDPDPPMAATDVLARFLSALGVSSTDIPLDLDERAARYRTQIAGRQILVVLDNAATVEQVRPLLPGTGSATVVVTSRDSLSGLVIVDGARRLDLDPLPEPDAAALLRNLIGTRVDREAETGVTLANQCARLPLALRIAAEMANSRPTTPLAALVDELTDQQRRLDLLDTGGDQRASVAAVFSWSTHRLPEDAARVFHLLGVQPCPHFDAYVVCALADIGLDEARRTLDILARAKLIESEPNSRYSMHDLLRTYAARQLGTPAQEAQRRVCDYYLAGTAAAMDVAFPAEAYRRPRITPPHTAVPDFTGPETARAWLDAERVSLVAIAEHMATRGHPRHAVLLSATAFRYLHGCEPTDALSIHGHAYRAAVEIGDPNGQGEALQGIGAAYTQLGQYALAVEAHQEALTNFELAGNRIGQARALGGLGAAELRLGHYERAAQYLDLAHSVFGLAGDHLGAAQAMDNLGILDQRRGRIEAAIAHHQRALTLFEQIGNDTGQASALTNLGLARAKAGDLDQAVRHHRRALGRYRQIGDRSGEIAVLDNLGTTHTRLGQHRQGHEYHQQALILSRTVGARAFEASALNGLGEADQAAGQYASAASLHASALSSATASDRRDQQARAHAGLGRAYRDLADRGSSLWHYRQALAIYTELGMPEADQLRAELDVMQAA